MKYNKRFLFLKTISLKLVWKYSGWSSDSIVRNFQVERTLLQPALVDDFKCSKNYFKCSIRENLEKIFQMYEKWKPQKMYCIRVQIVVLGCSKNDSIGWKVICKSQYWHKIICNKLPKQTYTKLDVVSLLLYICFLIFT